jgi:hypothetical protein
MHHLKRSQVLSDLEGSGSLAADLVDGHALSSLGQGQTLGGADVKDGQIGDDLPDTAGTGQRESALRQNLGVSFLIGVFHGDDDLGLLGVGDEVHGAADALDLTGEHEVSEVTVLADLQGAEHGEIDAASADHTETLVGAEDGGAGVQGDGFLARVDQVGILFAGLGVGAQAQDAVLGLQDDFDAFGEVGGGDQGDTDTEVDVHAILQFLGGTLDDAFATSGSLAGSWTVSGSSRIGC